MEHIILTSFFVVVFTFPGWFNGAKFVWWYRYERGDGIHFAKRKRLTCFRIALAAANPVPFYLIAPRYKRDKWHKIVCEKESCWRCDRYYGVA